MSQLHHKLQPPLRSFNLAFHRFNNQQQRFEYFRTDYRKWIVHFFGEQLSDLELLAHTRNMTLKTFELLMELRINKLEANKAQKRAEEEERQKKLLDKLKSAQPR